MKIPKIPNVKGVGSITKAFVMANRPELLFGASIVSTVSAVVTAGFAGYKSGQQVLKAEYAHIDLDSPERKDRVLDVKEKIQLTWLNYLPAAGLTGAALGATTGLHLVHVKEKKAIAAAALMAIDEVKNQANDYKEDVLKILDDEDKTTEEKSQAIEELEPERGWETSDVMLKESGYWMWDDLANRPLKSTRDLVRRASEVLLSEINKVGYADLNLFYEEVDLSPSQMGSSVGWTKEDVAGFGGKKGMEFVAFGLTDMPNGEAAVAFWFREPPTTDFQERAKS